MKVVQAEAGAKQYKVKLTCKIEIYRPHLCRTVLEEVVDCTIGIWYTEARAKEHYIKAVKGDDAYMMEIIEQTELAYDKEVVYTVGIVESD